MYCIMNTCINLHMLTYLRGEIELFIDNVHLIASILSIQYRLYIIVLINVCFHNGPVMCPRSLIMTQEVCIGPRQRRGLI